MKQRIHHYLRQYLMMALIPCLMMAYTSHAHAQGTTEIDTQECRQELCNVNLFAMGYIGFIGHISQGQRLYESILKSTNAESTFTAIINASNSTGPAKLYAFCGLKKLSSAEYQASRQKLLQIREKISTMKADIMSKQDLPDLVNRIDKIGCQD